MQLHDCHKTEHGFRKGPVEVLLGAYGKGQVLTANTIVVAGPRPLVIDPAGGKERHDELAGRDPILLFTHYHADHRASENRYAPDAETWAPAADASAVESFEDFVARVDSGDPGHFRRMIENIRNIYGIGERTVARRFGDGERIEAGETPIEIVALPGHTPGHSGIFFPELSLLHLTDIDLTPFGPWYGNDVSDIRSFRASLQKARQIECDWYFTSHIKAPLSRERFERYLDRFEAHFTRREDQILEALAPGGTKSLDELTHLGIVYTPKTLARLEHLAYFEKKHIRKHLEILADEGRVIADAAFERFQIT